MLTPPASGLSPSAEIKFCTRVLYCAPQDRGRPKEANMAKIVSCRDVGVDCDFVARGETEQDLLQQAAEHARSAHNMTEIPAELADKVRGAIRDEAA
jgi:predicted small metal-binding protein